MKKIILLLFAFLAIDSIALAQETASETDSLKKAISVLENDIRVLRQDMQATQYNIRQDLLRFNRQHRTGSLVMLGGAATLAAGVTYFFFTKDPDKCEYEQFIEEPMVFHIIGGTLLATGFVIQINAHKYLGGKASVSAFANANRIGIQAKF